MEVEVVMRMVVVKTQRQDEAAPTARTRTLVGLGPITWFILGLVLKRTLPHTRMRTNARRRALRITAQGLSQQAALSYI